MKAIFIAFDQAHYEKVIEILEHNSCRGFTAWEQVLGRGSVSGEPHYGSHAWPSLASAIIAFAEDRKVPGVIEALNAVNEDRPKLGLRVFVWDAESAV